MILLLPVILNTDMGIEAQTVVLQPYSTALTTATSATCDPATGYFLVDCQVMTDRWNLLSENTVIGMESAGNGNMTGDDNSLFGYATGQDLTDGQDNTFIGRGAGANTTEGDSNVFLGRSTGLDNITGNQSTFLGAKAGENGTDVDGGVFIGYDAGSDETTDNKLYIDNSDTATPLIYGDFATDELTFNADTTVTGFLYLPVSGTPATPLAGMVFHAADNKLYAYDGASWHALW